VLYNDYVGDYALELTPNALQNAWWELALFLTVFLIMAPTIHRLINAKYLRQGSQVFWMLKNGVGEPLFQSQLNRLFWACSAVWLVLAGLAVIRIGGEVVYYFLPFIGDGADPWSRDRIGGGIDAFLSLAFYLQLFVAGTFGITAALAGDRKVRSLALLGCLFTWPYFLFGWARNVMLAVVVPAILAWVFLRLRGGKLQKIVALAACFLLVNGWLEFVIAHRYTMSLTAALRDEEFNFVKDEKVHHNGLNMFGELGWINTFIDEGSYRPNWGMGYLAELVNPIPRSLWPGKPTLNIDYSGTRANFNNNGAAGVDTTISTGMIGQGVVNFGRVIGPTFAALLMSLWVAWLARLDLRGQKIGRVQLYALGIVLTFNLGRDITFITLYTVVFGSAVVWGLEWRATPNHRVRASRRRKPSTFRKPQNAGGLPREAAAPSPKAVCPAAGGDAPSKTQT